MNIPENIPEGLSVADYLCMLVEVLRGVEVELNCINEGITCIVENMEEGD